MTAAADPYNKASIAYRRTIHNLTRRKKVQEEVVFLSDRFKVGLRQIQGLYRISDAVLMTSHEEGFGLPVLEAGVFGKPVICPRSAPFTELAGSDAILIDLEKGPKAAAGRILRALAGNPGRREFRRVIRDYSWESIWERHLSALVLPGKKA